MPEWTLKYADAKGVVHQQVVEAASEREVRDRFTREGFLVYSVRARSGLPAALPVAGKRRMKINLEKFLVFNRQFVTLIKAGLPILKSLDLLADRLTDDKLGRLITQVRDEVKNGALLSDAFRAQGAFPAVYVTSVMAGEKSGSLAEVIERYIAYQQLAMAVRKKLLLSLIYPSFLLLLVLALIVFLVTYVVPNFAQLYQSMEAELPAVTQILIAVGTTARNYVIGGFVALVALLVGLRYWSQSEGAREKVDRIKLRTPVFGRIWIKYQVAQFSRVLGTLLVGGIPLVQAMETAGESLGSKLLQLSLDKARQAVKEGQALSQALAATKVFPSLAIDMIEVGESTGALPAMLTSVAEFYEDDVNTQMTAALSLIEPVIMLFMGAFVAFVLVALYLPIFSLAESLG